MICTNYKGKIIMVYRVSENCDIVGDCLEIPHTYELVLKSDFVLKYNGFTVEVVKSRQFNSLIKMIESEEGYDLYMYAMKLIRLNEVVYLNNKGV